MKAITKTPKGEIFFGYEDADMNQFRTWHDLAQNGFGCSYLMGYFRSYYAGCVEPIDELRLTGRPSIAIVKKFIQDCKDYINNN